MLSPGDRLGRYEILSALGAGGMGEVYRARDTQLDRSVALKVLPLGALAEETARKRFRKEAHALSRVSHPHVATLHDFDSAEGRDFLVMELVSGLSLDDALARGPLAEPDVLRVGAQIVRGLVAAHEQGVIHRDLKPSNIRLTADGLAKLLDFGLARTAAPAGGKEETTETSSGAVAGTPPYMSPEQLRGKPIDERTDVYGAGAVLYQMATGARPFGDLKSAELVAAILKEKPRAPREVNPEISVSLEGVIEKATDKEPGLRYQSAKELLVDLERLAAGQSARAAVRPRSSPSVLSAQPAISRTWRVLVATSVALVTVAVAWLLWPREPRISAYRVVSRRSFPISGVASDGSSIYFAEQRVPTDALLQMPLAGGEAREWPLPWTGGLGLHVIEFQKSPPSVLVLKVGDGSNGGELWRLPLPNGTPFRVGGLSRIGGARLSNGGDRLAYVQANEAGDRDALFVSDLDASKPHLVVEGAKGVLLDGWVPGDERIGYRTTTPTPGFWEVRADGSGPARPVQTPFPVFGSPEWSPDGTFLLQALDGPLRVLRVRRPFWMRAQPPAEIVAPADMGALRFTPDGRNIVSASQTWDNTIVRHDAQTGEFTPLLRGALADVLSYSPDGAWVVWIARVGTLYRLMRGRPDGSETVVFGGPGGMYAEPGAPVRWSPDGRYVVFSGWLESGFGDRLFLGDAATGMVEPLTSELSGRFQKDACWSPDGRSLVFSQYASMDDAAMALFRLDLATRAVEKLPGSDGLWSNKCAPDGRILAYDRAGQRSIPGREGQKQERQHYKLWEPARQRWTSFFVPLWPINYPNWSKDGRYVYASCGSQGKKSIVRFEVPSGKVETVLRLEGSPMASTWMDLAPDGDVMFHRDASRHEIVVMDWEER